MDDTQQSRTSDAAAAATRKRRSSILKSQRAPRTPFSELEFHVATPTDTAKSRRVSFSKRTGVAEFVTNEATTTWKNFYEEHNKSLESSGNDSAAHAPKPTIGHLGKRIFEQQFQEVEAFDFMTSIDNHSSRNINTSLNKVNFTQQIASLECTTGEKSLLNPQANLEMSAFTDCRSNVFGEDFAIPTMEEMSGRIDVNFSAVQAIGSTSTELKDDLDLIQEDLRNAKSNVVCPGPFNDRRSLSEYIEVDFNSTQVVMKNDESDMSITDTIHSPKVQDVSKSSSIKIDKIPAFNKDWVADKENIAVFEGCTSPVKSSSDKRKTIVYENDTGNISITQALPVNIIIPEQSKSSEKRKTIVYDSDSADISVTQAVPINIMIVNKDKEKRKTIIYENDTGNISVTQAIPSNIILPDKNKTIISQDDLGNISITQANPMVKIISSNVSQVSHKSTVTNDFISNAPSVDSDRHKTIIYGNESLEISGFDNNMSITKPIDTKHFLSGNYKEPQLDILSEIKHENHNMSASTRQNVFVYQASASYNDKGTKDFLKCEATDSESTTYTDSESKESYENVNPNRYEDKTQFLKQGNYEQSANIINNDTIANNIVKESTRENMPVLEDILLSKNPVTEKRKTIVYDNDMGNLSITQAIPANLILPNSIITQAIPADIILPTKNKNTEKRKTIVFDNDMGNLSITQAIPANLILPTESKNSEKRKTIVYDNDLGNLSITQAIPASIILPTESKYNDKGRTMAYDNDMSDLSITQALPANLIVSTESKNTEKRKTIVNDDDMGNLSITRAIPTNIVLSSEIRNTEKRKTIDNDVDAADVSMTQAVPAGILLQKARKSVYQSEGDISVTQAIPTNIILENRNETESEHEINDISFTQVLPQARIISTDSSEANNRTAVIDRQDSEITPDRTDKIINKNESRNISKNDLSNISVTKPSGDLQESMINELLNITNKIGNDMNKSKLYNSNAQDLFIYQAEMLEDIVAKNSNKLEQSQSEDSSDADVVRKRTSVSFAKADSNESYVEMNKSLQMSQPRLLTLESEEPPENLVSDEENDSNDAWNAPAKATQSNTTDTKLAEKSRHTVIDDLLDMSQSSLNATLNNNDAPVTIPQKEIVTTDSADSKSNDTMKSNDMNNETQTDKIEDMFIKDTMSIKQSEEPSALEYKEEKNSNMSFDVLKKILKTKLSDIQKGSAKHHQKEHKSDVDQDKSMNQNKSVIGENLNSTKSKNFRDANDTNELLEMLSDLTDKTAIIDAEEPKQPKEPVSRRTSQVSEANEPRRPSLAPRRLSVVLSREDMFNNISMAQAGLQQPRAIDDSLEDTSITPTDDNSPPKPTRLSNEVVKKLQFEDESVSEMSVKSDKESSPLKKTALGDFSNTKENKSKVIPDYLKNVSEDIKALMDDLVKPNADVIPLQGVNKGQLQKNPSTCSTQIQANLITSSQIDVNVEDSNSASTSSYNLGNVSTPSFGTDSKSLKSSLKSSKAEKPDNLKLNIICPNMASPSHTVSDKVLIFDHNNPLNNVLLVPPDYSNVHRYQPDLSVISAKGSESDGLEKISSINTDNFDGKMQQYNVESVMLSRSMDSSFNNASKCTSNQESIRVRELKDTKVNTLIAMKQNKELLETSSSLTLVDDTVADIKYEYNTDLDMIKESQKKLNSTSPSNKKSPVTLIYQIDEKDSNMSKSDEKEQEKGNKPKKRNYSPTKRDKTKHSSRSSIDNTPKQISKMQKLSTSPYQPEKLKAEKDDSVMDVDTSFNTKKSPSPKKASSPRKSKHVKDITVQQLITDYDFGGNIDEKILSKHIIKALSQSGSSSIPNTASIPDFELKSLEVVSSFTSSKNQMEMRDACSVTTTDTKSSARSCRSEWQPVKENESVAVSECDSSVNVVAKIDMLPFMGSHECEWEPSSSDTWSFRLLHARVRLTMRLAHRHDNATRTRVRADTPVLAVALDVAHSDKKNTVASLCVNFAAETMRQYVNRGCSKAGEVPALLRRCAGAARVALRWGRAMHEARLHLAYTLKEDGTLALKVANIPLRSVWEVTMRLQLVTEPPSIPWPRACDVTVTRIVSDVRVTEEEVEKLLANVPRDWGHVPRTIWKIFRYLKNKTRDDELLGLS